MIVSGTISDESRGEPTQVRPKSTGTNAVGMLEGKVGIVTGGGAGIGRATALLFAQEGARVVVAERDRNAGETVAAEIVTSGGEAIFIQTDVSQPSQVEAMVESTVAEFGAVCCQPFGTSSPTR